MGRVQVDQDSCLEEFLDIVRVPLGHIVRICSWFTDRCQEWVTAMEDCNEEESLLQPYEKIVDDRCIAGRMRSCRRNSRAKTCDVHSPNY